MATVRARNNQQNLYIRFSANGVRYEEKSEYTCSGRDPKTCTKCPGHLKALTLAANIEQTIHDGTFDLSDFFPAKYSANTAPQQNKTLSAEKPKLKIAMNKSIQMQPVQPVTLCFTNNPNASMELGEYATKWFTLQDLTYSTTKTYKSILNTWILPKLGNYPINKITPMLITEFTAQMKDEGKSPKHIKNVLGVLSVIMTSAKYEELVENNPVSRVKKPKVKSKKVDALSIDELRTAIDYLWHNNNEWVLFFAIGGYMGLRTGEIMGLQWSDFDFTNHTLRVQRTITNGVLKDSTKTAEYRIIEVPEILDEYIENHKQYTYSRSKWVFEAAPDISLGDYRPISKIWKHTLEACNIRYRTPYQLRHTFACNARDAGFTDSWIQHMLGHSTLDMLVRIYGNRKHILDGNRHGFTKEYVAEAVKNSSK